jgi:plastocyanin
VLVALGLTAWWFSQDGVMQIDISAQQPTNVVRVDRAVLTQNGWVVARGIEGDRLGQIIEISPFLKAGTHKNIEIQLGDFYNGEELIVVFYQDDGDGVFNGNDEPALDKDGRLTGAYVKTGEPLSTTLASQSSGATHSMPDMTAVERVRYTGQDFSPKIIEVPAGTMVEFINESDMQMWVASDTHPGHERLPTFDQFKGSEPGTVYRYTFDSPGAWSYHDHLNPQVEGTIIVL